MDMNLKVANCNFEQNNAPYGGAVQLKGKNIEIQKSTFNKNVASVNGGAVNIIVVFGYKIHLAIAYIKATVDLARFVIVQAFYPIHLVVTYKFSIHFHLQLYLFRCRTLLGRLYLFTSYALRYLLTFRNSISYLGIISLRLLPILLGLTYIFLYKCPTI